jgi:hypothetical protein
MLAEGFLGGQNVLDLMLMRFISSTPSPLFLIHGLYILFYGSNTKTWLCRLLWNLSTVTVRVAIMALHMSGKFIGNYIILSWMHLLILQKNLQIKQVVQKYSLKHDTHHCCSVLFGSVALDLHFVLKHKIFNGQVTLMASFKYLLLLRINIFSFLAT